MAEHKVYFDLPTRELGKSDVHYCCRRARLVKASTSIRLELDRLPATCEQEGTRQVGSE
jgi:hypothetical protein